MFSIFKSASAEQEVVLQELNEEQLAQAAGGCYSYKENEHHYNHHKKHQHHHHHHHHHHNHHYNHQQWNGNGHPTTPSTSGYGNTTKW